jgi:hypothetical protein
MNAIQEAMAGAIDTTVSDFRRWPQRYFTEEDIRWRLMSHIDVCLRGQLGGAVNLAAGGCSLLHCEYPTPFRCKMTGTAFKVAGRSSRARRGHFDIVVLDPVSAGTVGFEVVRGQSYGILLEQLPKLQLPFLECIVELKLFRGLSQAESTKTAHQQAELAAQAIQKVAATLVPQPGYYSAPFARWATMLAFDNSAAGDGGSRSASHDAFVRSLQELIAWKAMPASLVFRYITDEREWRFERAKETEYLQASAG